MFEHNHNIDQDLLMKAILEGGQEVPPARVWDGISEGLDRIERRRKAALWWRRASVGAVAAAIAIGVVLQHGSTEEPTLVAVEEDLISVIETPISTTDEVEEMTVAKIADKIAQNKVTAFVANIPEAPKGPTEISEVMPETSDGMSETSDGMPNTAEERTEISKIQEKKESVIQDDYDWGEDDEPARKIRRTTLTLSGITGSNNPQDKLKSGIIRQPSISKAPTKTGISESSSKNAFGIPLSAGVGIKMDLTDKWAIGIGIDYTLLSRKFYGTYMVVNDLGAIVGSPIYSDIRNNQHYIGIPVNVFYNILNNDHMNFYAYAGGSVEKCFLDSYSILNTNIVHKEKVKGVQLSSNVGIGVEFMVGKHLGLYVDPRLRYYFDCNQPKSIRTEQNLMAGVEIGARIKL